MEDLRLRIDEKRTRLSHRRELPSQLSSCEDRRLKIEDWIIGKKNKDFYCDNVLGDVCGVVCGVGGGVHPRPEPCLQDIELGGKLSNGLVSQCLVGVSIG